MPRRFRRPIEPETLVNGDSPLTEQQPKRVVYIEMFRAGPQISSTGQKMVFGEDELDQVVSSYNPKKHEAPLIIGHDQDDGTPSLGWVREVWRNGKALWGKVELTPKAETLIRDGVFKKVSSSFYLPDADTNPSPGSLSLRHLGLVSIPAVKGLTAFSELHPDEGSITITPRESSISFQETFPTMAKRRTEAPQVIDHADGRGMTINVNINGLAKEDGEGAPVENTGSPAPYDMEYGDQMAPDAPMPGMEDPSLQRMEMVEGPDGKEMGDEDDGQGPPVAEDGAGPDGEDGMDQEGGDAGAGADSGDVEDVSGSDDEEVASDLASKYTEEQLILALYQISQGSSEMNEGYMGYSEHQGEEDEEGDEDEDEEKEKEGDNSDYSEADPLVAKVAQLEEELASQRRLMRQKEISDFCEGLYSDGKLTQSVAPKGDLVRFMETLNPKNSVNFSETGKVSQFDFMKKVLENLPNMVSFGEVVTPASAPARPKAPKPDASGYVYDEKNAGVHAKALDYSEKNGVDYMSALKLVIDEAG
jgi:hypothetical protein